MFCLFYSLWIILLTLFCFAHLLPVLGRTLMDVFFKFGMEIIHIAVSNLFGNFIYLQRAALQKLLGVVDADLIYKNIKSLSHLFGKDLAQIGTVITKKRGNIFQLDIIHIIVFDIMNNIIHDTFAGWIANGADDHFELFCKVKYNFVQIVFAVDKFDDLGIARKSNVRVMVQMKNLFLDRQVKICQKKFDPWDILLAGV